MISLNYIERFSFTLTLSTTSLTSVFDTKVIMKVSVYDTNYEVTRVNVFYDMFFGNIFLLLFKIFNLVIQQQQ